MKTNIKVSIVVPVYNVEKYLHQCLDSLCSQTLKEIEIVCVDDGSQDNSMAILEEFAQKDSRIRIFENKQEGPGAAHARNLGVSKATGEYLLILDSDDYFHEELAEKAYQKAIDTDADIVFFDALEVDSVSGKPTSCRNFIQHSLLPEKKVFSPMEISDRIFQVTGGNVWNKLYRTSFVKDQDLKFQAVNVIDDVFFTYSSYAVAKKIGYIEDRLVYYRVNNSGSQTQNLHRDPLSPLKVVLLLQEFLLEKKLFEAYSKSFNLEVHTRIQWYLTDLNRYDDLSLLYHAFKENGIKQLFPNIDTYCPQELAWVKEIQSLSCPEYILQHLHNAEQYVCKFPTKLQDKKKNIILYGAGIWGKSIYAQNILHDYCNIVAWVDKSYQKIGFPVTGIETLFATEFDMVYITLERVDLCEKIRGDLIQRGIAPGKILYHGV